MQCQCGGSAKTSYNKTSDGGMEIFSQCDDCGRASTRVVPGKTKSKPKGLRAKLKRNKS